MSSPEIEPNYKSIPSVINHFYSLKPSKTGQHEIDILVINIDLKAF